MGIDLVKEKLIKLVLHVRLRIAHRVVFAMCFVAAHLLRGLGSLVAALRISVLDKVAGFSFGQLLQVFDVEKLMF